GVSIERRRVRSWTLEEVDDPNCTEVMEQLLGCPQPCRAALVPRRVVSRQRCQRVIIVAGHSACFHQWINGECGLVYVTPSPPGFSAAAAGLLRPRRPPSSHNEPSTESKSRAEVRGHGVS